VKVPFPSKNDNSETHTDNSHIGLFGRLFRHNINGNRRYLEDKIHIAETLPLTDFCDKYPTGNKVVILPIATALSTGVVFESMDKQRQNILINSGFYALLKNIAKPENFNKKIIFNTKTQKYQIEENPYTMDNFVSGIIKDDEPSNVSSYVILPYDACLSRAAKKNIAQYELLCDSVFTQGISNAKTFISFEKDASVTKLKQMVTLGQDIAQKNTVSGIGILQGASVSTVTVDITPTKEAIAILQQKIATDSNIPSQVLFELADSSSVFSGKSNSQVRWEQRIRLLQNSVAYPFYTELFNLHPQLKGMSFSIPEAFFADTERWQLFNTLRDSEINLAETMALGNEGGVDVKKLDSNIAQLKREIFNK
jgi:hypothetical protein